MTYVREKQLKSINKKEIELKEFGLKELIAHLICGVLAVIVVYMVAKSGIVHSEQDTLYRFAVSLERSFPFLEKLYQFIFV